MFYGRGRPPPLTSLKPFYEMKRSRETSTGAVSLRKACFNSDGCLQIFISVSSMTKKNCRTQLNVLYFC